MAYSPDVQLKLTHLEQDMLRPDARLSYAPVMSGTASVPFYPRYQDTASAPWLPTAAPPPFTTPLEQHALSREDDRRHVCDTCGKAFNRPSSLAIHINTHTGAKR